MSALDGAGEAAPSPRPLRLLAHDAEDLEVLSAALQDAVTRVGAIRYEARERRLTIELNRFCWECGEALLAGGHRVQAALQFGGVLRVRARRVRMDTPDAVVSILALTFAPEPGEAPIGGTVTLHLAGGGDIEAQVECVDALLIDLSERWRARGQPLHES